MPSRGIRDSGTKDSPVIPFTRSSSSSQDKSVPGPRRIRPRLFKPVNQQLRRALACSGVIRHFKKSPLRASNPEADRGGVESGGIHEASHNIVQPHLPERMIPNSRLWMDTKQNLQRPQQSYMSMLDSSLQHSSWHISTHPQARPDDKHIRRDMKRRTFD